VYLHSWEFSTCNANFSWFWCEGNASFIKWIGKSFVLIYFLKEIVPLWWFDCP
jgi:hypothetical protein